MAQLHLPLSYVPVHRSLPRCSSCSVVVSTPDLESGNPGSNPGRSVCFLLLGGVVAQNVTGAGFEPAPPKRPELGSGALDHSAILSQHCGCKRRPAPASAAPGNCDEGGVRTHASEEIAALTQRLRPLGHLATQRGNVQPPGFEPRTFAVLKRRHNQLDHGCLVQPPSTCMFRWIER